METRERILAAAARVFAEYGYALGTTYRVAESAGLSISSVYQYFRNKDEILVELAITHVHDGIAAVELLVGNAPVGNPWRAKPRLLVRAAIDNHRGDDPLLDSVYQLHE